MGLNNSKSIGTGHAVSEDGKKSIVFIVTDNDKACLSISGAREIAIQLLSWADHAEKFVQLPDTDKQTKIFTWRNEIINTWQEIKKDDCN